MAWMIHRFTGVCRLVSTSTLSGGRGPRKGLAEPAASATEWMVQCGGVEAKFGIRTTFLGGSDARGTQKKKRSILPFHASTRSKGLVEEK